MAFVLKEPKYLCMHMCHRTLANTCSSASIIGVKTHFVLQVMRGGYIRQLCLWVAVAVPLQLHRFLFGPLEDPAVTGRLDPVLQRLAALLVHPQAALEVQQPLQLRPVRIPTAFSLP